MKGKFRLFSLWRQVHEEKRVDVSTTAAVKKHTYISRILRFSVTFVGGFVVLTGLISYVFFATPWAMFRLYKAMELVRTQYAGTVAQKKLFDGLLSGAVASLGDRHSTYMNVEDLAAFKQQIGASYAGVGVVIGKNNDGAVVIQMLLDTETPSPAQQAHLRKGDCITAINGVSAAQDSLETIAEKIRGPLGSKVVLTIVRDGVSRQVTLVRQNLQIKMVKGRMIPHSEVAYIRIYGFSENSARDFTQVYVSLRKQGMKKLILDLRNNPGGLVEEAVGVATNFVPKNSTIISFTTTGGKQQRFKAAGTDRTLPIAVLINRQSASASEIIAGDIQDLHLGKVFGTRSYGKGTVQNMYELSSQQAIKLTIAKYHTSSGREIDGTGIIPDQAVPEHSQAVVDETFDAALQWLDPTYKKSGTVTAIPLD